MELVILIGLQAAGKTTFAHARFAEFIYVSKDAMRNVRQKGRRQEMLIRTALAQGQSVVVDNTNPTIADRAALIALAREYGASVTGYYFSSSLGECLLRNRRRTGRARVPDAAIYVFRHRLELPSYAEGFNRLYYVKLDQPRNDFMVSEWRMAEGDC